MSELIKAKVIAAFNDRENIGAVYQVGDTFEGAAERVDELTIGGYLEPIEKKPKKASEKD